MFQNVSQKSHPIAWLTITAILSILLFRVNVWLGDLIHESGANTDETWLEHIQHLTLATATVISAFASRRSQDFARWTWLLLSVFLALLLMEEINWGQSLFWFETPEAFKDINAHDELSLHNLYGVIDYVRIVGMGLIAIALLFTLWRAMEVKGRPWRVVLVLNALFGSAILIQLFARLYVWETQGFLFDELAENAIYLQILALISLFTPRSPEARAASIKSESI